MLGKPEMNLPGTLNFHDKSMQTTGVVFTAAHPNLKHGFPPGGWSLKSSTYFLPFLLTVLTLRTSLPLPDTLRARSFKDLSLLGTPYRPHLWDLTWKSPMKSKCFENRGWRGLMGYAITSFLYLVMN